MEVWTQSQTLFIREQLARWVAGGRQAKPLLLAAKLAGTKWRGLSISQEDPDVLPNT
jgi:hypothetical protein